MKKLKKLLICIMLTILVGLGINQVSMAYEVGQTLKIGHNDYKGSNNIFCLEHNQTLKGKMTYKIISQVIIKGNKSTDTEGKTIENVANGRLAAILTSDESKETKSNAIWNFAAVWMENVGKHHAGLYSGFASGVAGKETTLNQTATDYADSIANSMQAKDNTDKNNIKVKTTQKDGKKYIRVGPFNWSFAGQLTELTMYDQNNQPIEGKQYSTFNGITENWINVENIQSGSDFYISIPLDGKVTKITKITANAQYNLKSVKIWFLEASTSTYQNLIITEPNSGEETIAIDFPYDIGILGDLKVIKVNKDNKKIKLKNVGFYIKNEDLNQYVKKSKSGDITYVDKKEDATEFKTNKKGEISIKNLIVGTYAAYETKNPNYGYKIVEDGKQKEVVVDKTSELVMENKQVYIKLSGYVWEDLVSGKQSYRNDLFKDNNYDSNDILLDGITVRLKDKTTGKVVIDEKGNKMETKTANGGKYQFKDVLIEKLKDYYIEFEYDGLTYTNVVPHIDKDNGSKAAESSNERKQFNQNFSVVEGTGETTGITRDANGNEKHKLQYNVDKKAYKSTLINNGQYTIKGNTDETKYKIKDHFEWGQEEIKNINLGLYRREQPDISLVKDLDNIKITVNGYNHVYQYAQRFVNQKEYGNGFNIGVKYGSKYGSMSYSRAIYQADYEYVNEKDKSRELKVYVTYRLAMRNEATNLNVKVNSIADYYDKRYTITKVGTGTNQGDITGEISHTETAYNNKYTKTIINNGTQIDAQKEQSIYVQFELNKEAVLNIINAKTNLDNVAEINSYSVYDKTGNIYAGIDTDSNPGSVNPEDKSTYQDDTDSSPALKLEVADPRVMTGKVFLDATDPNLNTAKIRQGNGKYDEKEKGIEGVEVTLKENTGSGKEYKTKTDQNGDFKIDKYIPGDYTLTYTWGDKTYTVQNYKGTVYNAQRDQKNKQWYKVDVNNRLTDALDDYKTRENIDKETATIVNNTTTTIDKMNSTTPTMGIGVEYESVYTASSGDRYIYEIKNVDFGIVERARQELELQKRVETFKVTLANGQVVTDVTIDENGKITGEKSHMTYMGPSDKIYPKNGFIKVELDNELIQGALVEVGYKFTAKNNSELDYKSEQFYKYGIVDGKVITMTPAEVIDYLDNSWAFEQEKNTGWEVKQIEEIKDIVSAEVFKNEGTTVREKTILYTNKLATPIEPGKTNSITLNVSKKLTTTDEISLGNETEITKIERPGGSVPNETPGNYIPGKGKTEVDDSIAETVIVTPSTGNNKSIIIPISIGVVALVILATGVVLIRKKALGENKDNK